MKRIILALALAGVLGGAVYGAAASLGGLSGQNFGADDAVVASCDSDGVRVNFQFALDPVAGKLIVHDVTLTGLADACIGKRAELYLTHKDPNTGNETQLNNGIATATVQNFGIPNNNLADIDASLSEIPASQVDDIHIVVE
jgi:hypothetical protein